MCRAVEVALRVERAAQLALGDRMEPAVQHVLLARPDQLHRRARQLAGDGHRLADPVVDRAAPAEAAAEMDLVDLAAGGRQARRVGRRRQRRLAVLRRASRPRSARPSTAPSRSSAPWSRGSGRDSRRPPPPRSPRTPAWRGHRPPRCRRRPPRRRDPRPAWPRSWHWTRRCWARRPTRSAAHRVRSWPATRSRRRPRRRCRRRGTTFFTPGMPVTAASSKPRSLPPNTGQSRMAAFSIPGSLRSMP